MTNDLDQLEHINGNRGNNSLAKEHLGNKKENLKIECVKDYWDKQKNKLMAELEEMESNPDRESYELKRKPMRFRR